LAIAERSKDKIAHIGGNSYSVIQLKKLYLEMIKAIGGIVRYGYVGANPERGIEEEVGTAESPIVEIEPHFKFIEALLLSQSNLERRSKPLSVRLVVALNI